MRTLVIESRASSSTWSGARFCDLQEAVVRQRGARGTGRAESVTHLMSNSRTVVSNEPVSVCSQQKVSFARRG